MTQCLKKNVKIEHTPEFINSFNTCKKILINDPILQYPDFSKPFNLTTDASNFAIGAVLSQGPIGQDLPIAYASRTLNPAEINYSTIEKELLAIVWAVKYFRPYLFGKKFKIISDHKPLQWLFSLKEPNSKLVRWRLKLEEYDYEIIYKKGKLNTNADALSRVEIHPLEIESILNEDGASIIANPADPTDFPIPLVELSPDEIDRLLSDDSEKDNSRDSTTRSSPISKPSISKGKINVINDVRIRPPPSDNETNHTSHENPVIEIPYTEKAINNYKNQIIISLSKTNKTSVTRKKIFDKTRITLELPEIENDESIIKFIREYMVPKQNYCLHFTNKLFEKKFIRIFKGFFKNNAFTLCISNIMLSDILDEEEQKQKLQYYHETKTSHRGIQENLKAIKRLFYWPKLDQDVKDYINSCEICQQTKYERHPNKLIFKPTPIGYESFDHLYADTYKTHNQYFVTIVDSLSKFGQAYPINSPNAIEIANKLLQYFNHFGIPRKITVDNGHEWKNETVINLCEMHGIEIHFTTLYNPNSNSPVERFHSTIAETLLTLKQSKPKESIDALMNYALLSYNNSIHSATNFTPFQIIRGKLNYKNPLELDEKTKVNQFLQEHQENIKTINEIILENLKSKQQNILEKRNVNRQRSIDIDITQDLYKLRNRNASQRKTDNPYEKLETPLTVTDNKIKSKSKTFHKKLIKPQRIVSGRRNAPGTPHNRTRIGVRKLTKSKGNKKSNTTRTTRSSEDH